MPQEGLLVSARMVLKDSVSPDDIERLAESARWQLKGYVKKDIRADVDFSATWRVDDGTEAHLTEDGHAGERYFVVSGAEWRRIDDVLDGIRSGIAVWTLAELILEADGNIYPASRGKAVLRLGLGAPLEAVDPVRERILAASEHPEARVRRRAVWAMACTPWPEYRSRLEEIANADPDETVAREARAVAAGLP